MIIWADGTLTSADQARIDPRDRGFTLGDGLYETIRVQGGQPRRLDAHLERLRRGLAVLGFPPVPADGDLAGAMEAVLAANGLGEAALRLTVSRGVAARGLLPEAGAKPTIVISASPFGPPQPSRLVVARRTRRNQHSPLTAIKTTNCLDSVVARLEAAGRGADDAVLLNGDGQVAETTIANIFARIGDGLVTPPIADGLLPGTMRAAVIAQLAVEERSFGPELLERAEEIFLTSALGVRPVVLFEGRPLTPGAATARAASL